MPASRAAASARVHAGTVSAAPATHSDDEGSMNPFCMSIMMSAARFGSIMGPFRPFPRFHRARPSLHGTLQP